MTEAPEPGPVAGAPGAKAGDSGYRDELPAELDVSAVSGPYQLPDNKRRRVPGLIYLGTAAVCLWLWLARHRGGVLVNRGLLIVAGLLVVVGLYHLLASAPLKIREVDALAEAARTVGFPVGHASGQLAWRGLRSRPTWRILLYSADEPPTRRGLVLVDGVDGHVVDHFVEDNPEDWSDLDG
jgi:hypothetical protein